MSLLTTATGAGAFLPEDYAGLIEQPVALNSVAYQVSTLVRTTSHQMNFPIIATDPTAAWTAEGTDIDVTDPVLDELEVVPKKLAGLVAISREMARDSNPASVEVVGRGLARDIAKKIDQAFFDTDGVTANGPGGIAAGTPTTVEYATGGPTNYDAFAEAISEAETLGYNLGAFAVDPAMALTLSQLKQATASNVPLLGSAATDSLDRRILGVPLVVSPYITAGTIWGIPKDISFVVQRQGVELEVDHSVYFGSDRVAVRAIMRIGFAFPHEAGIIQLVEEDAS